MADEFATCPRTFEAAALAAEPNRFYCLPTEGCCIDEDDDNYGEGVFCDGADCNDNDELVYPGADELCNGDDDNCDNLADNAPIDCAQQGCSFNGTNYVQRPQAACTTAWRAGDRQHVRALLCMGGPARATCALASASSRTSRTTTTVSPPRTANRAASVCWTAPTVGSARRTATAPTTTATAGSAVRAWSAATTTWTAPVSRVRACSARTPPCARAPSGRSRAT
ncbi:MAG: putative metal-binding motif-containing protein [Sandaracinaceae bacterium]|nr:putative metal-binding motif-containing protein [Sandaracinaceae bacterium]